MRKSQAICLKATCSALEYVSFAVIMLFSFNIGTFVVKLGGKRVDLVKFSPMRVEGSILRQLTYRLLESFKVHF